LDAITNLIKFFLGWGGGGVAGGVYSSRALLRDEPSQKQAFSSVCRPVFWRPISTHGPFWLGLAFPFSIPFAFFSRCQVRVSVLPGGSRDWDFSLHADG